MPVLCLAHDGVEPGKMTCVCLMVLSLVLCLAHDGVEPGKMTCVCLMELSLCDGVSKDDMSVCTYVWLVSL